MTTVSATVWGVVDPLGKMTKAGEKEQVAYFGRPLHAKLTVPGSLAFCPKPATGPKVSVTGGPPPVMSVELAAMVTVAFEISRGTAEREVEAVKFWSPP